MRKFLFPTKQFCSFNMVRERIIAGVAGHRILNDASMFIYRDMNKKAKVSNVMAKEVELLKCPGFHQPL